MQIRSGSVLLAYIPSPSSRFLVDWGPFHVRWYGLLLALGVLIGCAVARHELQRRGIDGDLTYAIALWVVPFGLVGARLYHVVTDWSARFAGHWERIPQVWEGGLGIYGALLGGCLGGAIAARRYGIALPVLLDCIAPGTALAQALGRFGNYFNQELFGGPTKLPWALEISLPNRPAGYTQYATFQPTFLYESLWCLLVAAVVLYVSKRAWRKLPGRRAAVPVPGALLGGALLRRGAPDRSRPRDRAVAAEPGRGRGGVPRRRIVVRGARPSGRAAEACARLSSRAVATCYRSTMLPGGFDGWFLMVSSTCAAWARSIPVVLGL